MTLFETFQFKKTNGEVLNFNQLTLNELKQLHWNEGRFDWEIAELFNISKSKVQQKRRKMGITRKEMIIEDLINNKDEDYHELNQKAFERIMTTENIDVISKALTNFAFRSGPVEDIHSNNQLTQKDMKTLNKFIVNRLSYVIKLIIESRGIELEYLIRSNALFNTGWDAAEEDDGDNFYLVKQELLKWNR
ncbi:hypothetical protein SAMN04487895_11973 [Paenibacillus sophorae]|uniref:Uncharacterized protein n=1 Tax=Paenibacillus sophorae TaxID=1333845 RepID=A0A1H8UWA1_9BACL|nr:hypothetical protein [Paenibacillus sophorae]QWU15334.1 hypothetical protein KP014_26210 [Paenibacillus sophorae]SEP07459.1 hypothetical protein SAMN04487895_11973 [Paenibacillus sophorae]